MNVLIVTGDKRFGPGHPRYDLQKSVAGQLTAVYVGRGSVWPTLPEGHYDTVTVQDPFWRGVFAWVVAWRLHARFNVQVHADLLSQSLIKRMLARFILRRAHSVRVVSERIKAQVKKLGVQAPITVLPVFLDQNQFSAILRRAHQGKNILWIGRFEDEKDPYRAIDVLKSVMKEIPDVRLTMIGEGSMKEELSAYAAHLPISVPLGFQNTAVFLETADVVLSTSKAESWGASIVEALASGVPVVAPDVGVAKEAGAIVVPRDELARAVARVLKDGAVGVLKLSLPDAPTWAQQWKMTLQ